MSVEEERDLIMLRVYSLLYYLSLLVSLNSGGTRLHLTIQKIVIYWQDYNLNKSTLDKLRITRYIEIEEVKLRILLGIPCTRNTNTVQSEQK